MYFKTERVLLFRDVPIICTIEFHLC